MDTSSASSALNQSIALDSLMNICIVVICIGLSWWGLQAIRFDLFLKRPKSSPAIFLQILLSIALGSEVARFIIEYFHWSSLLKGMF
ncbi:DUF1146 family protein [Paenibacillus psychroresistens]|nr:DUF1146 family protein [Paenibacillus psychroresistens]